MPPPPWAGVERCPVAAWPHAMLWAGPWWVQWGGRRVRAPRSPLVHESCGVGLSVSLHKHTRGISGGSLMRNLLFLNSWKCWSALGWLQWRPGCPWVMLGERWMCCHGAGRCLQTPPLRQLSRLPAACPNCGCAATKQILGDFHKGYNQRSIPCFLICAEWVHL